MNERIIDRFFDFIQTEGHRRASIILSIEHQNFDVFCSHLLFSHTENLQMLQNQEQGCFLYTNHCRDNPDFIKNFKDFLGSKVISETTIISDIFNQKPIKILKIKVDDGDFRLIYEINSADRLRVER